MKHTKPAGLALAVLLGLALLANCDVNQLPDPAYTPTGVDLRLAMRELWSGDATWTQIYVADAYGGEPDAAGVVLNRLMRNMDQIADRFKTYYGDDTAERLGTLLRNRVSEMSGLVAAAPLDDSTQSALALDQWNANSDSLAGFLAGVNPHWKKETLVELFNKQVDLTGDEVIARRDKKFEADIRGGDEMHLQVLRIADELSRGIIQQFPTNFQYVKPH